MGLEHPSQENIANIVEWMRTKLRIANTALFAPEDYRIEDYEELYDIYQMMQKRESLTSSEMSGILDELGQLRRRNNP